jgi:aspartate beta-hydroxylase
MTFFYDQTARLVRQIYDKRIFGPPVLDAATHFPDAAQFASSWQAIRDEALAFASHLHDVPRFHEIMREQVAISDNDKRDWRLLILKAYGAEVPRNMAACPRLAAIVKSSPDVLSASISFLAPGKHIPAHRGPFRGVLRFYLVLSMPKAADGRPAAVLKIADEEYRMDDGECLLWDDTYVHEVWNASDAVRIVLLLDVWRHSMPIDMEIFSRTLLAMVRVGMRFRGVG